jgi:hypothetical protein
VRLILPPEKGIITDMTWDVTNAQQDQEAALLRRVRPRWVRQNISWYWTDGYPELKVRYRRAADLIHTAGGRVIFMVNHSPERFSGSANIDAPPLDPADYADFLTGFAAEFSDVVDAWEIWNEENHPSFWPPAPNAADFTALLAAGAAAIRAVDPGKPILFGGMSYNDYTFLEDCYAADADLGDHFDVMCVHPYTRNGVSPETVYNDGPGGRISIDSFTGYQEVGAVMATNGDRKPIWITEMGWSTCSPPHATLGGVSEAVQADYLQRAFRLMQGQYLRQEPYYVSVACIYMLRANTPATASDWVGNLALVTSAFVEKLAFYAVCDIRAAGWRL